jgi:hypothetical protein
MYLVSTSVICENQILLTFKPQCMTEEELRVHKSLLFMLDHNQHGVSKFLENSELRITKNKGAFGATVCHFTFSCSPAILKSSIAFHDFYQSIIKKYLHEYHHYPDVIVELSGRWEELTLTNGTIEPIITQWEEINKLQKEILIQVQTASTILSFKNVGNSCRGLLEKLSDFVFDEKKHKTPDNNRKTDPGMYKNRLWCFITFKLSGLSSYDSLQSYAKSILDSSDKAINLSNDATHSWSADNFLAQSCAISSISIVHIVKLASEMTDPS